MATRRTTAPRKRPASQGVATHRAVESSGAKNEASEEVNAEDELRQELIQGFESALREQGGLDQDGFEFLMAHLREAMEATPLHPERQELDRSQWMAALDAIAGDSLEEDERNALVRQLNEAIDPLKSTNVRTASEFAERLQREGEAAALAWLGKQRKAKAAAESPPTEKKNAAPGRQSITSSRSRRLRGPPV